MLSIDHILVSSEAKWIQISKIKFTNFNLPRDHELIKQTELVFLQLEHENSFEEQLDMIRKLDEITSTAIAL